MCQPLVWATRSKRRLFTEDADVPGNQPDPVPSTAATPTATATAKWAGEVLPARGQRPVRPYRSRLFRCDMILARDHVRGGSSNVPDLFTRLMLSLVATGYRARLVLRTPTPTVTGQCAHYDGLSVGLHRRRDLHSGCIKWWTGSTYHVMNPHDDGIGLDEYVRLAERCRLPDPAHSWLRRLAATVRQLALRALPDTQRHASLAAAAARLSAAGEADPWVDGRPPTGSGQRWQQAKNRPRTRTSRM